MSTLPDNLTDDDRLLLHLAGEADDETDRAVVARLAANPQAGQDLRDAWSSLDRLLSADAAVVSRWATSSAASSAKAVVTAMIAAEVAEPPARERSFRLKIPTWTLYPLGAAAAVVLAMVGWWYNVRNDLNTVASVPNPYDSAPSMLVLRGAPDEDLSAQTEEEIGMQFDSMIADQRGFAGGGFGGGFGGDRFGDRGGFGGRFGGPGGGGDNRPGNIEREFALMDVLENVTQ